jgi:hypothetical protein
VIAGSDARQACADDEHVDMLERLVSLSCGHGQILHQ